MIHTKHMLQANKSTTFKIKTKALGEVSIDRQSAIDFPEGILGFPDVHQFALLPHRQESPFHWLQNIDDQNLAFILIDPISLFHINYHGSFRDEDFAMLGWEQVNVSNFSDSANDRINRNENKKEKEHIREVDDFLKEFCQIFAIVTIPENHGKEMTANLQGPIVIQKERRIGKQCISDHQDHVLHFPVLENLEKKKCSS